MMIISPIPQIILILLPSDFGLLRIALDRMLSQAQAHSCQVASGPRVHGIQLAIFLQPDDLNCTSNISGWWFQPTPLKNDGQLVSWDEMTFPTEWKDKKCSKPPPRYIYIYIVYTGNHIVSYSMIYIYYTFSGKHLVLSGCVEKNGCLHLLFFRGKTAWISSPQI